MSTMPAPIYDALKEAGASEEKARAAATSLTGRDQRWEERAPPPFSLILAVILSTIVPLAQFQLFLAAPLLRGDLMIEAAELAFRE